MLSVILTILKILGFIVGGVVALVLLLALAVLFVPIRYKIDADGKAPNFKGKAKASWLLSLVSARADYDGDLDARVKILFFTIKDYKKELSKDKDDDRDLVTKLLDKFIPYKEEEEESEGFVTEAEVDSESTVAGASDKETADDELPDLFESKTDAQSEVEAKRDEAKAPTRTEATTRSTPLEKTSSEKPAKAILDEIVLKAKYEKEEAPPKPKLTIKERLERLWKKVKNKIKSILQSIKAAIKKALDKLRAARDKYEEITDFLDDRKNREAFELIKNELLKLLKHIRPRKLVGSLRLGLEDPATTGRVLGVYYMLFSSLYKHFEFVGEFEEEVIEGKLYIKGHIRLIYVLVAFIKLYKNKRIKKWLKNRRIRYG